MAMERYTELVTPTRSTSTFSTSWRMLYAGGDTHYDNMDCVWFVNGGQFASHYGQSGSMSSDSLTVNRKSWYPYTGSRLSRVHAQVRGTTTGGYWGPWLTSPTLNMRPPATPEVDLTVTADSTEQEVKVTVSCPSDTSDRERCDTVFTVTKRTSEGETTVLHNVTSENSSMSYTGNFSVSEMGLNSEDKWIEITASARSRGLAGDSSTIVKKYVIAWPHQPQITSIEYTGDAISGMVMVGVNSNQTYYNPTYVLKLQRRKNTKATTPAEAANTSLPGDSTTWSDVTGAADDGDCIGFVDSLTDAYPTRGLHTWYRLKASAKGDAYTRYSAPFELPIFEAAAVAGAADIVSAKSGDDGESAKVVIGWATDEASKTQVSWARSAYAWESSGGTSEFSFDWEDATPVTGYDKSATVYISGLEEGTTYYVRARRVVVSGDAETYGAWSAIATVKPASAPEWVELSAPSVIARGDSLPLTWTFGSEAAQKGWRVTDSAGKVWASGSDADGAATIPAEELADVTTLVLAVSLTTGGDWVSSTAKTVRVAERPECDATVDATVTAQYVAFELEADVPDCTATITVTSDGATYERPDGTRIQYAGDVIHAAKHTPQWTEDDGTYYATVFLPVIDLLNGVAYAYSVTLEDTSTGLASAASEGSFAVEWEHLASAPTCSVTPNADALTALLVPVAPSGVGGVYRRTQDAEPIDGKTYYTRSGDTYSEVAEPDAADMATYYEFAEDVCDVYRVTPDGAALIAEGVMFGMEVTDRFAPFSNFGNPSYRVATRTADGDVSWRDFAYTLAGDGVRLDWGGEHVMLPYNLGIDVSIATDFEARKHKDGVTEGYWEDGSQKASSITTDMVRVSRDQHALLKDMARHAGAVFVRTYGGEAYDADVSLNSMTEAASGAPVAVSLNITEVALTAEHMCGPGDVREPATTTTTTTGA